MNARLSLTIQAKRIVKKNDTVAALAALAVSGYYITRRALTPVFKTIISRLIVDLCKLPMLWPSVWCLERLHRDITGEVEGPAFDRARADRLRHAMLRIGDRVTHRHPRAYQHLDPISRSLYRLGDTRASNALFVEGFLKREQVFRDKGLDRYGFRLISPTAFIRTIGNGAQIEPHVRARILGLNDAPPLVLPLPPGLKARHAANPALLDYWKTYIDIVEDPTEAARLMSIAPEMFLVADALEADGKLIPHSHSALALTQARWEAEGRPPFFTLTDRHQEEGRANLARLGIGENDWFVCLHVREGGFKGEDPCRQAAIADYHRAIRTITARGGRVIRMGDPSMRPLEGIDGAVDYARSEIKSDWMDLFLCATCRFFIGTSSGLYHMADAFGRPFVQTNYLPTGTVFFGPRNLFVPKRLRSRSTGAELPLGEAMSVDPAGAGSSGIFRNALNLEWINNTAEEIEEVVVEIMDRLDGRASYSAEEDARQAAFKQMTADRGTLLGLQDFPVRCRIGQEFLNRSTL